jgi:predicted metal-binding membrane protein
VTSRTVTRRPQLVAEAVAVVALLAMLDLHAGLRHHASAGSFHAYLHGSLSAAARRGTAVALTAALLGWMVMSAAMMLPIALPAAKRVGVSTLRTWRHKAVAAFVGALLAVWLAYGIVVLTLTRWWAPGRAALPLVLALAAGWQFTGWHRRVLLACHRTIPMPPAGAPAIRASSRYGFRYATSCVGASWALMLVMAVARSGHLAWAIGLGGAMAAQELLVRPRRTSHIVGVALLLAAAVVAVVQ